MKTELNRLKVLAIAVHASVRCLRKEPSPDDANNALECLTTVAEELETIAAEPQGRTKT